MFFFFRFAIDKDISCGSEKRRGKGGRSGAAERENKLLALYKKERRAVRVVDLVSQISRRQRAGDCSDILKHTEVLMAFMIAQGSCQRR